MPGTVLRVGKLPSDLLARILDDDRVLPPEVRLGPAIGEDGCAIALPAGVLVAATDPITLTGENAGKLAVLVNANDVAVCGARPRWFLTTVLLPPGTSEVDVREVFTAMRHTLDEIGAVLVGGHTEVTAAVTRPVIVGQMLGMAERGRLVTTGGAQPDDAVVQIGPVPIEGAAVLASEAGTRLGGLDPLVLRAAAAAIDSPGICVVEAALAAAELGATALHDPTEGGLAAGLHELAHAGRVAVRIDAQAIAWFAPGLAVCRALDADPWATLASGAVIATFPRGEAAAAVVALARRGHTASIIGVIEPGAGVLDNAGGAIPWPERDEVARILSS